MAAPLLSSELQEVLDRVLRNGVKDPARKQTIEDAVKDLDARFEVDEDVVETFSFNNAGGVNAINFDKFVAFCKDNCERRKGAVVAKPSAAGSTTTNVGVNIANGHQGAGAAGANGGPAAKRPKLDPVQLNETGGGSSSSTSKVNVPTPMRGMPPSSQGAAAGTTKGAASAQQVTAGGSSSSTSINNPHANAKRHVVQLGTALGTKQMATRLTLHESLGAQFVKDPVQITSTEYPERKAVSYKFLDLKPERRAVAINERLEDMETLMRQRIPEDDENVRRGQVGEVQQVTQEISVVGRILCDEESTSSTAAQSKLNESSFLLEGSRGDSNGHRMYAVGRGEKDRLHANRFVGGVPVPERARPASSAAPAVHIVAASGPFSKRNEMDFTPLKTVLQHALSVKPQMVILLGPFLDANNTVLKEGSMVGQNGAEFGDPLELTEQAVVPILEEYIGKLKAECQCEVFIVPSPDESSFLFATPQPSYPSFFLSENWSRLQEMGAHLVPNPCFLRINDAFTISCTSQDPLSPLIRAILTRPEPESGGRLEEVMRQLLRQRSWFPRDGVDRPSTMVANVASQMGQPCVDVTRREKYEFIRKVYAATGGPNPNSATNRNAPPRPEQQVAAAGVVGPEEDEALEENYDIEDCVPDILLFASVAGRGFQANLVEDRLFVNPGHCCKINQHGTFAELFVYPASRELARVEIRKLPDA
eukprot:g19091.t1